MASIMISSDLRDDPFVNKELPTLLRSAGHSSDTAYPLEKVIEAARQACFLSGGFDLAILVHSTKAETGVDSPYRVVQKLRAIEDRYSFRNAVKAKSLPVLIISAQDSFGNIEQDQLAAIDWVTFYDIESSTESILTATQNIIFKWRTDLLRELECAGYAVTLDATGISVRPAFKKADVKGEIMASNTSLSSLKRAGYLVVSSDVFRAAKSYRHLAYLIENYRTIAKVKNTKPEEVFQDFFTDHPDMLFTDGYSQLWPKPRFLKPEDSNRWLEPDFVVKPNVAPQLGSKWKVLDLKLPDVNIVGRGKFHPTLSHKLIKALQQLANYHKYFGRIDTKKYIESKLGFQPRNPKLALLIGRKLSVDDSLLFDEIAESMLNINVEIISYDEVLETRSLRIAHELEWLKRII